MEDGWLLNAVLDVLGRVLVRLYYAELIRSGRVDVLKHRPVGFELIHQAIVFRSIPVGLEIRLSGISISLLIFAPLSFHETVEE